MFITVMNVVRGECAVGLRKENHDVHGLRAEWRAVYHSLAGMVHNLLPRKV
jgi:hypothetical protein